MKDPKEILFESIRDTLKDNIPELKTVDIYNNQIDSENEINPYNKPACFIEFASIDWGSETQGYQKSNTIITLHAAVETYLDTEFNIFQLINKIHCFIHGLDGDNFTPLNRIGERQDADHDNVQVWEIDYSTSLNDNEADIRKGLTSASPDLNVGGGY